MNVTCRGSGSAQGKRFVSLSATWALDVITAIAALKMALKVWRRDPSAGRHAAGSGRRIPENQDKIE
jgi:hypothetical protein